MGRKSISDEARERTQNQSEADADEGGDEEETSTERVPLTQRMPEDLLDRVDIATEELMLSSRNATINHLVKRQLDELGIDD